jgi:hypothetical protein
MGSHFHGNQICIVEKPQVALTIQQMALPISFTGSSEIQINEDKKTQCS